MTGPAALPSPALPSKPTSGDRCLSPWLGGRSALGGPLEGEPVAGDEPLGPGTSGWEGGRRQDGGRPRPGG